MKKKLLLYRKPSITKKKIKLNYFWSDFRFQDSLNPFNGLLGGEVYLASGGCFLPGTKVVLATSKYKNIENIKTNEVVVSYDPITMSSIENKVKNLFIHGEKKYEYIIINSKLNITSNHRLWVNNHSWKRADELRINDYLLTKELKPVVVKRLESKIKLTKVYNLELYQSPHTFFAESILSHNGDSTMEKTSGDDCISNPTVSC